MGAHNPAAVDRYVDTAMDGIDDILADIDAATSSPDGPLRASSGALVTTDPKGKPSRLIASAAAIAARDAMRGRYARCPSAATWHQYTDTHWTPIVTARVHEALTPWLYTATDPVGFTPAYQDAIITLLERGNMLSLPVVTHNTIPFRNGLLDIESKTLHPLTPANAHTWCLPYEYAPGATCQTVREWLLQAVDNDSETVELLRAWMGALLRGMANIQRFLHLIGPGGTGKSTFIRLTNALIGAENATTTSLRELETNRFETASVYGKRLVAITDSDKYGGSVNVLKALTGQDPIRLERKHVQQAGSFVFGGLVLMASNEALQTTDYTSGLERRRLTVHFHRRVTEADKSLWRAQGGEEAVLHRELPGLVNWVLQLSEDDIIRIVSNPPARIADANLDAMSANTPLVEWMMDCCAPSPGTWTQIGDKEELRESGNGRVYYEHSDEWLYASYLHWCRRSSREALSIRRFRAILIDSAQTLGVDLIEARRGAGRGVIGIRLLRNYESPVSWRSNTEHSEPADKKQKCAPIQEELVV